MLVDSGPSAGALGGAANERGSMHRAGVLAFAAAHVLRGRAMEELGLPPGRDVPVFVRAEVDAAVDDVEVVCAGDCTAWLQVKTRLDAAALRDCVEQWVKLARQVELDPARHRVLACGAASGPVLALRSALTRHQRGDDGSLTRPEERAWTELEALLVELPGARRDALLRCAGVWDVNFGDEIGLEHRLGDELLDGRVVLAGQGRTAWQLLREHGRVLASERAGAGLIGLTRFLRSHEAITLVDDAEASAAAAAALELDALEAYRAAVGEAGRSVSLTGVGAGLPPIPLDELDMSVNAIAGPPPAEDPDKDHGHPLPWLVRAYARVLLSGAPGSGKSVAVRAAAAEYADREDWPLPLVVHLPRWQERRRALGDRPALLEVAFEDQPVARKAALIAVAERALGEGDALLALDSLDETGAARRSVVEALRMVLTGVHSDVEVVLATRDVGYADAHALGFTDLSLVPPAEPDVTIERVLQEAAIRDGVPDRDRESWVETRVGWVRARISPDQTLRRTPLMVVLLTLLAASPDVEALPRTRATVLRRVVRDAVRRWEHEWRLQGEPLRLGPLDETSSLTAVEVAFDVIGHHVLGEPGVTADAVIGRLARVLAEEFGLAAGGARAAAERAVHVWDVGGVFVKEHGDERLRARVQSLAELAEAHHAIGREPDLAAWTARALTDDVLREPLQLAAALSAEVADALATTAAGRTDWRQLEQIRKARENGARFSAGATAEMVALLARGIRSDLTGADGWAAAVTLVGARLPAELQGHALDAIDLMPDAQRMVARVLAADGWPRDDHAVATDLRRLLDGPVGELPVIEHAEPTWLRGHRSGWHGSAYAIAVRGLLRPGDDELAAQIVADMDRRASFGAAWRVRDAVRDAGYQHLLEEDDDGPEPGQPPGRLTGQIEQLVALWEEAFRTVEDAIVARVLPVRLSRRQRRRLDQGAALRRTLDLGRERPGQLVGAFRDDPAGLGHVMDAVAALKQIDLPVAVAQLSLLNEIHEVDGAAASSAIESAGVRHEALDVDWACVPHAERVVTGLVAVVGRARPWMSGMALSLVASVPRGALREVAMRSIAERRSACRAWGLEQLTMLWIAFEEPKWSEAAVDARPAVRRAAARAVCAAPDPRAALPDLVRDTDQLVRDTALREAHDLGLLDDALRATVEAAVDAAGWECRWCGAANDAMHGRCQRCEHQRGPARERG